MKCIVHLNGKNNSIVECNINLIHLRDNCDPSELYNEVCETFPNNDWEDICCDNINYHDNYIECFVTVS